MRITHIDAFPVRLPRNLAAAQGTAGSPTAVTGSGDYRWSSDYPVLYPVHFETALVRVTLEDGSTGWGEAQAPLAPEVACTIVERLLRPAIMGEEFTPDADRVTALYDRMYATMRVRGQTGGFMLDAISGADLALWDLAGKQTGKPVAALIAEHPKTEIPAYLSGTTGATPIDRAFFAERFHDDGFGLVKLYFESCWQDLLAVADALPQSMRFAVDALWHMPPEHASAWAAELDARHAMWLECPLYPEEIGAHQSLAASMQTPLAIGESYRTVAEIGPFLPFTGIVQPDLGRTGITGALRIARAFGGPLIPHVSIAMGPQIAAALQLAAALPECELCEFNPNVHATANAFLAEPLVCRHGRYGAPQSPGLGVVWNQRLAEITGG